MALPHPEGKTLLTTRSQEYRELAPFVDLDVAGDTLALKGSAPYASFRRALDNPSRDELELAAELANVLAGGHEPSIAATLSRSIERLGEEGRDFLRLASLLAPAPIPAELVEAVFARADELDEAEAGLRSLLARKQVRDLSLAEPTPDGAADSVHTLVVRSIRFAEQAEPERREVLREAAIAALTAALEDADDPRMLASPVLHARALLLEPASIEEAELLGLVGGSEYVRGDYPAAGSSWGAQHKLLKGLVGEEHPETLRAMNRLAMTLLARGELADARALQEQVLEASRRLLGKEHPATLTAMNNLALTLQAQGDLAGTRVLQEQVLEARERLLGKEHLETLNATHNLAGTLHRQGDLSGARALEEQVLEARRRLLGEEHPETLKATGNLAETLRIQGDLEGARALQERVLVASQRLLGEEHPDTLRLAHNLALTLQTLGDLDRALTVQERVLEANRRLLGEEHPHTLSVANNLAATLWEQGDVAKARALEEQVLESRARLLGDEHPDTLRAARNLAAMAEDPSAPHEQ